MQVGVIGAGIVGLACAHWLTEDGHQVTVIDRDPHGDKCSWGNAGGIAVTEVVPASMPGLIWRVPGWLADPLGPLSVRPAHLPAMLPWLRRFLAAGRAGRVAAIAASLAALNMRVHDDLVPMLAAIGLTLALRRIGALTVYETSAGFERDRVEWDLRRRHGIACEELTGDAVRDLEPALGGNVRHGVFTPAWSQVSDPKVIWAGVRDSLLARGVAFAKHEVVGFAPGAVRFAAGEEVAFDMVVIAAGAWSARLAARIGDRASLESERGYNTTLPAPGLALSRQVTFGEHKFVASPLACGLRIGGAAEFARSGCRAQLRAVARAGDAGASVPPGPVSRRRHGLDGKPPDHTRQPAGDRSVAAPRRRDLRVRPRPPRSDPGRDDGTPRRRHHRTAR